jgi:protein-S-isoprenylcysteine O-methyltransferase Ste14
MRIIGYLLVALWALFGIYWLVSAINSKKSIRNVSWSKGATFRILMAVVILLIFQTQLFQNLALQYNRAPHLVASIIGVCLCALGLAFAVWARIYLGTNWGMPMTLKEHPELVTSGPYKFVRHPIYTGMLLAMIGSSLIDGVWWLLFLVLFGAYFIYSAKREEKIMTKQFPNEYPAYIKKTKMLIPFIF